MSMTHARARHLLNGERLPCALVDLGAFDRNVTRHLDLARAAGLTLRPATKSVRVVALLRRLLGREGMRGLMCFSVREAAQLAELGFDDLFVAYPPHQRQDLEVAAQCARRGVNLTVAIDSIEAVEACAAVGRDVGVALPIALCVDMSLRLARGRVHVGVRRSPLHDERDVLALVDRVLRAEGVRLTGVLGYEAQVAGLGDRSPYDSPLIRMGKAWVRRASMRDVTDRRSAIVRAVRARGVQLSFVNGGGTGSLDVTGTASGLTEVTAGSGFFKPLLFDGYRSAFVSGLEPACWFALEVTRRPAPGVVTCFGGGYVASGAAGPDKLPRPVLPTGLDLLSAEGAGEVQTPVAGAAADGLSLGDPVLFRHAKAGELMERFAEVLLVDGDRIVDRVPTYRGQGYCFG